MEQITLFEYCSNYLEMMKFILSPTTFQFYKQNIKAYILPFFGDCPLESITTYQVQKYIAYLLQKRPKTRGVTQTEGTISPSTVKRYLTVLKSILRQAYKQELIQAYPAPMERLTLPKPQKPNIEIFTRQEVAAIIAALDSERLQFKTMIYLAIYTGARRGELVGLKFSDFDFEQHKMTIQRSAIKLKDEPTTTKPPKDYEPRTISINPMCTTLVEDLRTEKEGLRRKKGKAWSGGDWLFTDKNGNIMNPMTPTRQFSKFLKRNGLKHKKFHALRHTSATLLLCSGVNIKQVQTRLGHSNIETTNKYLHYISEADEEATAALTTLIDSELKKLYAERA